ncbi:hypothetical protein IEQ11_25315 [Lysobacter capsici]|uniref:hypothetical protein n=1 Tax=Lysobacter capsici TaxID=435897 RepID=UPI0012FD22AD|nr:hypothetical protein [Lysobacter capsici]UOF14988.1 hypothetical protein IEQ11_25315 [Lysobacter capsici]
MRRARAGLGAGDERATKNPHADAARREVFFVIPMRIADARIAARGMSRRNQNEPVHRDEMRAIRYRRRVNKRLDERGRFVTRLTDTLDANWLLCAPRAAIAIATQPGIAPTFIASHGSLARPFASSPHR